MSYSSAIGSFNIGFSPIESGGGAPPSNGLSSAGMERIYDMVQTMLPSITTPVIDLVFWNMIEEFCIRSTYLRATVYWQLPIGANTVDFNPFSSTMIVVWVIRVSGLTHWQIVPPAQLVDMLPATGGRTGAAQLVLRPASMEVVRAGMVPELFSTWYETMLDGVLFRLYGMPVKPWSSPQLAQYHGTRFRQGINRARDIAERLHSDQQSPSARFPYYARGRRKN